jgi:hypothetical protein
MNKPSIRARKFVGMAIVPAAILIAGALVWQSSYAAFTASTRNAGNSWSAGQVSLTDDDNGTAAFTAENLVPGESGTKCIVVTSNSSVAGEVRTYVANLSASGHGLEEHIVFRLESGTGGSFNDCAGFTPTGEPAVPVTIKDAAANTNSYANGGHAWTTTGTVGEKMSYRASWTFDTTNLTQDRINALQGATVSADLVWELQTPEAE